MMKAARQLRRSEPSQRRAYVLTSIPSFGLRMCFHGSATHSITQITELLPYTAPRSKPDADLLPIFGGGTFPVLPVILGCLRYMRASSAAQSSTVPYITFSSEQIRSSLIITLYRLRLTDSLL